MSDDDKTPREPRDWRDLEVPSIPADDPIFREGVIITFPIRPRPPVDPPQVEEEHAHP